MDWEGWEQKADDLFVIRCAVNVITNCARGKDFEEKLRQPAVVVADSFLMHAKFGCVLNWKA